MSYLQRISHTFDDVTGELLGILDARGREVPFERPLGSMGVFDGDSITAVSGGPSTVSLAPTTDAGWITHAIAFAKLAIRWVDNRAVSNQTTAQQRVRLSEWLYTTSGNFLSYSGGTNSITSYVASGLSETAAALATYRDLLFYLGDVRAARKFQRIFVHTLLPRGLGLARNEAIELYNRQVRALCAGDATYELVDDHEVFVDPTSGTLSAKANMLRSDDNLHPTPKGARAKGLAFATAFMRRAAPQTNLMPRGQLTRAIGTSALYSNLNPMFTGATDGTRLLGSASGVTPLGWRAGVIAGAVSSCVASVVADAEGIGNAQRLVVSGAGANSTIAIVTGITDALPYQVANDWHRAVASVRASGMVNVKAIKIRVSATTDAAYSVDGFQSTVATINNADFDQSDIAVPYYMHGPAIKFPGNTAIISVFSAGIFVDFNASGGGAITLDVSRFGQCNLGQFVSDL